MIHIAQMSSPAPAFRRVDLPALLFPPSPPQSRTSIAGPSQIRLSHLLPQLSSHSGTGTVTSDSGDDVEDLLSLQEAQVLAKSRLRGVVCLWRDSHEECCGAILASVDLLGKHLAGHVHAYAKNLDQHQDLYVIKEDKDNNDNDGSEAESEQAARLRDELLGIRCHWDRCSHHGMPNYDRLLDHVETVHVGKLVRDHCPHKNCIGKAFSDSTAAHALRAHPGLWTEDRLRPETPHPHPISPVRQLRPLPTQIVTWLISCHPIGPTSKSNNARVPSPPRPSRVRAAALRSRLPSEASFSSDRIWPVMHERDPNDYWPMNGEAEPHGLGGNSSSSIFPPVVRETVMNTVDPVQGLRIWAGKDSGTSFRITKKPALPRRPLLFTGADIWARHVKAEPVIRKKKAKAKAKTKAGGDQNMLEVIDARSEATMGKREAEDDESTATDPYSRDRIIEASTRRAARVTGRTIGFEFFEEMVTFEQRGIELGVLPTDHSFKK